MSPEDLIKIEKEQLELQRSLERIFLQIQSGDMSKDDLNKKIDPVINAEEFKGFFSAALKEKIKAGIAECVNIKGQGEFMNKMLEVMGPILEIRRVQPKMYEDVLARESMKASGFTPLNERVSYNRYKDEVYFHLAPSFQVKEQLPLLYLDAMKNLAEIVRENKEIKHIVGTSWIVAKKKYGDQLKALGFEITDVDQAVRDKHFKGEKRAMKKAVMTREKFLNTDWAKLIQEFGKSGK